MSKTENRIKAFHKMSERHVFVLVPEISHADAVVLFHLSEQIRLAGNELTGIMKNNYEQLMRTKRYRKLKRLYGKYAGAADKQKCRDIASQMNDMQREYGVTWDHCRKRMITIGKKYGIDAVFALTKAEDVWRAAESCLYSEGQHMRFAKRGELPAIRAKQICRGIILNVRDNTLYCRYKGITMPLTPSDRYEADEIERIISYLNDPGSTDAEAADHYEGCGELLSTYRPCYVTIVCETIRNRPRIFVHITTEGKSVRKYRADGTVRHQYGYGKVGVDIGTQTIAYTAREEAGLENLAERGSSMIENEKKEKRILRAMDRSRRAANPQNYNEDGTVRSGRKQWKYSNRYRKLKRRYNELSRRNAVNRRLAVNEEVNHLRSIGHIAITESRNAKKLMKKARPRRDENGVWKKRKRFGRSIRNRCPGYFQKRLKDVFESTGGTYIEVPDDYRASQYDHTCDAYIKKKLSDRMYALNDGTVVQRDLYSSYLLYHYDPETGRIDKENCISQFEEFHEKETLLIGMIRRDHIKVMNSGI